MKSTNTNLHSKNFILFFFVALSFICNQNSAYSQNFLLVGDAFGVNKIASCTSDIDTCFTLTPNANNQAGAVWDLSPIDLSKSFDATFCLTLGNDDHGADGFAFVMRSIGSDSIGHVGGGLGYEGITPSIAIEYDTYDNGTLKNDLGSDHTGMYVNSNWTTPIASSVPLDPGGANIEDGNYHTTRIVWNINTHSLTMYFDGNLRVSAQIDLVNNVFNGANLVYWGFTASTGGSINLQQICFPQTSINLEDITFCDNDTGYVSFYTDNITSYTWSNLAGDTIVDWNSIDYPTPFDLNDTIFTVTNSDTLILNIDFNNNTSADTISVTVVDLPSLSFVDDSLEYCPEIEDITLDALNPGMSYSWTPSFPNSQTITDNGYTGYYHVEITEPILGCKSEDSILVTLYCDPIVIIPNVFTPNGDNQNDFFELLFGTHKRWVKIVDFTIFSRWGNAVYTNDTEVKWDGKHNGSKVPNGTYYYILHYSDIKDIKTYEKKGFLVVLGD
ncbi:MAG: hypothetical protein COB15_10515 [Flavobacteriales bacterium]|nr:MAG: hypothetical protein COB15_10515 [Flavobacteriales bacterium]